MKICFASDNLVGYHKSWAGAEQACYRLAKLLIKNNHNVFFLTEKIDKVPEERLQVSEVASIGKGFFSRKIKSVLRHFFPFDPIAGFSSYRALKKIRPDILHLHRFNDLSLSLVWSAKRLGIPVVFSMYDFWFICPRGTLIDIKGKSCTRFQGENCDDCLGLKNKSVSTAKKIVSFKRAYGLRKKVIDYFFNKIDAIIVLSNSWAETLEQYGIKREKISIIPLPLFEKIKRQESLIEENSILFVGWIYPHKGLHVLIEALPLILKEIPQAKLYIVESGVDEDYKDEIIKTIEKFKMKEHVSFLGKLPNEKVQTYLQKAKVVAVPEQWGIAWPIFLTEAMALGKPIVASRIGDIPVFIKDGKNGFLVEPQDSANFAGRLIWMLKEKEAVELGKQAKKDIIEICDENKILEKLENTYFSLTKKK